MTNREAKASTQGKKKMKKRFEISESERMVRTFDLREIRELAPTGETTDSGVITGHAAVFDQPIRMKSWFGMYDEVIRRGSFARTIENGSDVFAHWNHNSDIILGRRKNGTLKIHEDDIGLRFEITPPNTSEAQEKRKLIREGFVDKMSFGFSIKKYRWTERDDDVDLLEFLELRLFEVSPVPFPAYEGTDVSARSGSAFAEFITAITEGRSADEIRSAIEELERALPQESTDPEPMFHSANQLRQRLNELRIRL